MALGKIGGFDLSQDMLDLCLRMIIASGLSDKLKIGERAIEKRLSKSGAIRTARIKINARKAERTFQTVC